MLCYSRILNLALGNLSYERIGNKSFPICNLIRKHSVIETVHTCVWNNSVSNHTHGMFSYVSISIMMLCNIGYPSATYLKLKFRESSFVHNFRLNDSIVLKFCTEHGSIIAVLCSQFQTVRTNKTGFLGVTGYVLSHVHPTAVVACLFYIYKYRLFNAYVCSSLHMFIHVFVQAGVIELYP